MLIRYQVRLWTVYQLDGNADPTLLGETQEWIGNRNSLEQYPSRPAAEALSDYISRFRSLEWFPGGLYDGIWTAPEVRLGDLCVTTLYPKIEDGHRYIGITFAKRSVVPSLQTSLSNARLANLLRRRRLSYCTTRPRGRHICSI